VTLIQIREERAAGGEGEDGACRAVLSFDQADEFPITVSDPFTSQQERRLEWYYEEHLRFPFTDRVKAGNAAASVVEYGDRLFAQVFADPQALARYLTVRQEGLERVCIEIVGSPRFTASTGRRYAIPTSSALWPWWRPSCAARPRDRHSPQSRRPPLPSTSW
jgi:hypothetical protein